VNPQQPGTRNNAFRTIDAYARLTEPLLGNRNPVSSIDVWMKFGESIGDGEQKPVMKGNRWNETKSLS